MGAFKSTVAALACACGIFGVIADSAGAYATVGTPPKQSPSTGPPDGRVYEEVSPADKHGYYAGASGRFMGTPGSVSLLLPGVASVNGNAFAFHAPGPAAEVDASGLSEDFVAERTPAGWRSHSSVARILKLNEKNASFDRFINWPDYSSDLSHLVYQIYRGSVPAAPEQSELNIYRMGSDPLEEPTWLLQSVAPLPENRSAATAILGMTPDSKIVYFAYEDHLLPEDESRSGGGIYESRDGEVREVGVLPDGSVPSGGAVPASEVFSVKSPGERYRINPASLDNMVSTGGNRVFFVASGQLYVHKLEADGTEHSVLVSASQLPNHEGELAPDGVVPFENRTKTHTAQQNESSTEASVPTYAYASPDGSHVIFQSMDQLTSAAPGGNALKVYDFDVDAGTLEYLPGISLGGVVTAADDGSSFLLVNSSGELELWTAGAGGGSVRQIAQLPPTAFVGPGRMVADHQVIVFQAEGPVPGFIGSAHEQIYRFDVASNVLTCISCSNSVIRSGNAYLSPAEQYDLKYTLNDARGVSSDGRRIFFASPDALVSRDTNGDFDTYEWENGNIFLISPGTGTDFSPFLDNSESGGDVFFATADELVEGDNDGGFDVYDARIPRPGDNPPPSAVPCSGDVCQGPPSVPQLLSAPASAAFSGAENLTEEGDVSKISVKSTLSRAKRRAAALRACRQDRSRSKRQLCEKRVRKRYAAAAAAPQAKHNRGEG